MDFDQGRGGYGQVHHPTEAALWLVVSKLPDVV